MRPKFEQIRYAPKINLFLKNCGEKCFTAQNYNDNKSEAISYFIFYTFLYLIVEPLSHCQVEKKIAPGTQFREN